MYGISLCSDVALRFQVILLVYFRCDDFELFFITKNGKYNVTHFIHYCSKGYHFRLTPHGLRHTSASLLAAQGLDVTSISKRLGHARTSTTMDIYAHALQSSDNTASNMLENLLIDDCDSKSNEI
jgi:integrase